MVEGSVQRVAASVKEEVERFVKDEDITDSWGSYPTLDAAFREATEFSNVPTVFLVLPTQSRWSVLWNNSFLCNGYDSLCSCLTNNHGLTTLHWSAHDKWTSFQSGAHFIHRRLSAGKVYERSVHVGQQDKRWHFYQSGVPLTAEDLGTYKDRLKRNRLNEEKMSALLARLGAHPWLDEFYAVGTAPTFVLKRVNFPASVIRRASSEVIGWDVTGSAEGQSSST